MATCDKAEALRAALGGDLPGPLLYRDPARRPAQPGAAACAMRWRWPAAWACRWWPPTRCSSSARTNSSPTKRASASPRARCWPTPSACAASTRSMCFKSQAEMAELFADMPGALANSVEIAKRCNVTLTLGKPQLPNFPTPGMTIDEFLVAETQEGPGGAPDRSCIPDPDKREQERPRYEARLEFETNTIIKMKFPGYFLIVAEFIQWGKNNGVPIGPGRGSGAGSLVAYALKITDLDPLEVQPAVRALPESRTRLDARLRHRLLPGKARTRDPAREGFVRPGRGLADRHLRHHGGQGRDPRRRPRARLRLQLLRRHLQADPVQAGQAGRRLPTPSKKNRCSRSASRTRRKSSSCSSWPSRSKASPATSACTPAAC